MNLIMFGPNGGHNIDPFISLLRNLKQVKSSYITKGDPSWASSPGLNILSYKNNFSHEIKILLQQEPSLVWVHAGYDIRQLLQVVKNANRESRLSLNIWGEQVPFLSKKLNLKGIAYRYLFNKFDQLHCNWYGTSELLEDYDQKVLVRPWGLSDSFFTPTTTGPSSYTQQFIKNLPKNKYLMFYPKSILPVSGQLELIEAVKIAVSQGLSQFKIYLWVGNSNDEGMLKKCEGLIRNYNLADYIDIIIHPFLPFGDIKAIWNQMNCGVQLAKSDQLSSTFLEPQFMKKELLCSDIKPYKVYEKKYNLPLSLIDLEPTAIASRITQLVKGKIKTTDKILEQRSSVVLEHFNFSSNIKNYLYEMQTQHFSKK